MVILLAPLVTFTASPPHGPISESRTITLDTPEIVMHAPLGFEIRSPEMIWPSVAEIGPESVKLVTRGPAVPVGDGAGLGPGVGTGVGVGVGGTWAGLATTVHVYERLGVLGLMPVPVSTK